MTNKPVITRDIEIGDLVTNYPFTVRFLSEKGIKCIACGEPIWGTLEEAALEKGFSEQELDSIIREMKEQANDQPAG